MHNVSLENVGAPGLIKDLKGWLVWRYEEPPGAKKPLKMPYYINGQRRGANRTPEDRENLTDFDTAKRIAESGGYTGVGFAPMPDFNVTILDFDNVVDSLTGDIHPDVPLALDGTYYEYSPSGNGIRGVVTGSLGNHKTKNISNYPYGFETFTSSGWCTFTGNTINKTSISKPNTYLLDLISTRWPLLITEPLVATSPQLTIEELPDILSHLDANCSYYEWLNIGMAVHFETQGAIEGFNIWDTWSQTSSKYSTQESNLSKWDSFGNHLDIRPITGRTLLKMAQDNGYNPIDISLDFLPIKDESPLSSHYNIRSAQDYVTQTVPTSWLIKGLLPKANLGVLYGESGSGKSFVALDMCAALSRGVRWNNLRPPKSSSRILYVVAEGAGGFVNRINAYCQFQDIAISELNIDIISDVTPNLVDKTSVKRLIEDIKNRQGYDLIVMDTFAQVTPGANENSGEDMGTALEYCKQISIHADAMVLLIHHSGKDASKGARGWSGVRSAADVVLEVSRNEMNVRKIRVDKQKDGIDGEEFGFKLNNLILGHDEDGDPISSCVIEYCEVPVILPKLKDNQQLIVDTMNHFELYEWVTQDHLLALCLEKRGLKEGEEMKYIKSNIKKTITNGIDKILTVNEENSVKLIYTFREN